MSRTWEAAERRRTPVVVRFPGGRAFAFPSGVSARRVMNLANDLKGNVPTMSAIVAAREMILRALVPLTDDEVEARKAEVPADVHVEGAWCTYDDLLDLLDFDELSQVAGFLYQTYVMGQEPSDIDAVDDVDPPVPAPEQPTDFS